MSGLGIELEKGQLAISDIFEHGKNIADTVVITKVDNLFLVLSKIRVDKT